MHIEFLVEERSAEAALQVLLPKMLRADVTFNIHAFNGKADLLRKLPGRLSGYRDWIPEDWRIVVLIDEDREDCATLKAQLVAAANAAPLPCWSASTRVGCVVNRIVVEELEAWFFGDVPALVAAFPGVPPHLGNQVRYRNPDAVSGGTWEALEQVLQKAGHHKGGLQKIAAARAIATQMDPARNRSQSFRVFRDALSHL